MRARMEALAAEWTTRRDAAEGKDRASRDDVSAAFARGQGDGFEACAVMLREALAAEAAPVAVTPPRRVDVPSEWATAQGITYGRGDIVRSIPLAGPGRWRVVGIGADRPGTMALWVVPA